MSKSDEQLANEYDNLTYKALANPDLSEGLANQIARVSKNTAASLRNYPDCSITDALHRLQQRGVNVHRTAIVKACREGRLRARLVGRTWLIDKASLDAYAPQSYGGREGVKPKGRTPKKVSK